MADTLTPLTDRLGVFERWSAVPDRHRLHHHATAYDGRDAWAEYRATVELSDRMDEEWTRFARRWKAHMADRRRHHALATPADVEAWSTALLDRFSVDRAYQHWTVLEGFYEYLKTATDHPHAYNPFHLAALDAAGSTRQIWDRKMEKRHD
jgi:hypothetical protein